MFYTKKKRKVNRRRVLTRQCTLSTHTKLYGLRLQQQKRAQLIVFL